MTLAQLPARTEPLVDENQLVTLPWQIVLEGMAGGDTGTAWTPTFTNLTSVGTPTIAGKYYRLSQRLAYFIITITPATSTTSVAGTTYCNNFPLNILSDAFNVAISGSSALTGGITASDKKIYPAGWSALTNTVTITGLIEVS